MLVSPVEERSSLVVDVVTTDEESAVVLGESGGGTSPVAVWARASLSRSVTDVAAELESYDSVVEGLPLSVGAPCCSLAESIAS